MGGHEFSRPYQSLRCTMEAGGELVDIHRKSDSFFRFLSILQSNANHCVLSYSPLLRSFVVHNNSWPVRRYVRVLQIFMLAPACENSRRSRRFSGFYDRCPPMSRNQSVALWFGDSLECPSCFTRKKRRCISLVDQNLKTISW